MAVVAFAFGLHWGAIGVAAAYSLLDLVVRTAAFVSTGRTSRPGFGARSARAPGAAVGLRGGGGAGSVRACAIFAPATLGPALGKRIGALLHPGRNRRRNLEHGRGPPLRARFGGAFASTKGGLSREAAEARAGVGAFPKLSETFVLQQIVSLLEAGHDVRIFAFEEAHEAVQHPAVEAFGLRARTTYLKAPEQLSSKLRALGRRTLGRPPQQFDAIRLPFWACRRARTKSCDAWACSRGR